MSKVVRVRSSSPLSLSRIEADRTELRAVEPQSGSLTDHAVTLTIQAPVAPGPFHGIVRIESDIKDEPPAQIRAFATIIAGP